jgi:hypothetical protein
MAPSFRTLAAAGAMALALTTPSWGQAVNLQLPCVPAPAMEADLASQGFKPVHAKEDGDGDPWITFEHADGRWVLMLYLVEPTAQCFVARGGNWNMQPEKGA